MSHLFYFFFNDTATTEIYTLSLHDALPISLNIVVLRSPHALTTYKRSDQSAPSILEIDVHAGRSGLVASLDRKSTRLNSSHQIISYAVFCLKKKTHIRPEHVPMAQ